MIKLSQLAIAKIKEISDSEGFETYSIRVKIIGGGCSGYQNDLLFDNIITDLDEVFHQDDVQVIIDSLSLQYLDNVEIDYIDNLIESGFKFKNDLITNQCGCGKSFSF